MAQYFVSVHSVVREWVVIVLDVARVVSLNLQLCNPDLDVEPFEISLLQLVSRCGHVIKEEEPFIVLHGVVETLR